MKKVAFHTLGCKVNQYETEAMASLFIRGGYNLVDFSCPADVYVINTCTITGLGDKKSRQMIRRARRTNPAAVIVAAGCYAQISPGELQKLEGVSLILGTREKGRVVEYVEEFLRDGRPLLKAGKIPPAPDFEVLEPAEFSERTRAYIKIQDGCDKFCSYCIIPYARGISRSRPAESVLAEANRLADLGYTEVVLTGIHVASYGRDIGLSLLEIIRAVHSVSKIKRIRLSSIDPLAFTEDFVGGIARLEKVCPHFHISLQSGCDKTLAAMRRRYDTALFSAVLSRLRAALPGVSITTDIIAGFPGETEDDHLKSLDFIRRAGFLSAHVFPYSERRGTAAADMPEKVSKPVRERRAGEIFAVSKSSRDEFLSRFAGAKRAVLFETGEGGIYEGYTDNYIRVSVPSIADVRGGIHSVRLVSHEGGIMRGVLEK